MLSPVSIFSLIIDTTLTVLGVQAKVQRRTLAQCDLVQNFA